MGRWQYEEVAGDRYIYDLSETPYVLGIPQGACKWAIQGEQDAAAMMSCEAHNADCDAYEAKIAELEEDVEYMDRKRFENRAFAIRYRKRSHAAKKRIAELEAQLNAACRETQDVFSGMIVMADKLARIAELVKPVPVADLVEAGTEAPALLAERHRQIRAILEDEGNE